MAGESRMEKVNMSKEFAKLSGTDQYFVRKLEQMNKDRAKELKTLRRKNWLTALVIGTGVISICILVRCDSSVVWTISLLRFSFTNMHTSMTHK